MSQIADIIIDSDFSDWNGLDEFSDFINDAGTGFSDDELLLGALNENKVNILDFQNGQFVITGNITTSDLPQSVRAADINNDGKVEVAVIDINNVLQLFRDNSGTWESYYTDSCSSTSRESFHLEIGNIDDDSYLEVVYACSGPGGELVVLKDTGTGVTRQVITTVNWDTYYDLEIGNLDNDNYNEIFITDETNDQVRVYEYNGVNFSLVSTFPYPSPMFVMDNMDVGDLNNDGVEDLIACGNSQRLHIFNYQNGSYQEKWTSEWLLGMTEACKIGDFDGDGSNEIAVSAAIANSDDYLHYYDKLNSDPADYTFVNLWQYQMVLQAPFLDAMTAGDYDADSVDELSFDAGGINKYWDNDSVGPPFEVKEIPGLNPSFCFASADVDRDSGVGGQQNLNYDLDKVSVANNDNQLFFKVNTVDNINLTSSDDYYSVSIDDNLLELKNNACNVFDVAMNPIVSDCSYAVNNNNLEVALNLIDLGISPLDSVTVIFETGNLIDVYDNAPNSPSYIDYFVADSTFPSCGNSVCEGLLGESCNNCGIDCTSGFFAVCGDGFCHSSETSSTCSLDCETSETPAGDEGDCFKGRADGVCHPVKDGPNCPDCIQTTTYICGDGVCDATEFSTCEADCSIDPIPPLFKK